jgi:hypothetical protein
MWIVTTRAANPSGSPRSIIATMHARLAFVKHAYFAVMRFVDADNEHRPDFPFRRSATRDLVREAMVNSANRPPVGM